VTENPSCRPTTAPSTREKASKAELRAAAAELGLLENRVAFTVFRDELSDRINAVHYTKKPLGITRHGKLVAVLVPVQMYKILKNMEHCTISEDS
jgi:prevent-host-death family protein